MPSPHVTITPSAFVTTYGTTPLIELVAGGLEGLGRWKSPTGDGFDERIGATTNFLPLNREHNARITLEDVIHPGFGGGLSNATYNSGTGHFEKTAGADNTFNAGGVTQGVNECLAGDCSVEATLPQTNKQLTIGLTFGTHSWEPFSNAYAFALLFKSDGTVQVYSFGDQIETGNPVLYEIGDVFELAVSDGFIKGYKNGELFIQYLPTDLQYPVYGIASFYHLNAAIDNFLWWAGDEAGYSISKTILVHGSMPGRPNWRYNITHDVDTKMSLAEDRSATFSEKTEIFETIDISWQDVETDERDEIKDFWDYHKKSNFWTWNHPDFGTSKRFRFDAALKEVPGNASAFTLSSTITQNPEWQGLPLDNTAPAVAVTNPEDSDEVSGTITLTASATDNDAVASVQFQIDGVNVGGLVTSAPWELSFNTAVLTDASHDLRAIARDFTGNQTYSAAVSFTVNN